MADTFRHPPAGVRRSAFRHAFFFAALVVAASLAAPDLAGADRVSDLLERADEGYGRGDLERAAKYYARADREAGGRSLPAVQGLARTSLDLLRLDDSVAAAERWRDLSDTPEARAVADHYLGLALHWRGLTERWDAVAAAGRRSPVRRGAPEPPTAGDESLRAAADAFRRALGALGEKAAGRDAVLLALADVLTWLEEYEEATAALDAYAATGAWSSYAENVRCWAKPSRADRRTGDSEGDEALPADHGEVEPPVKVHAPAPRYPPTARAARLQGAIVLQAVVTREGAVECVRPLQGNPVPLAYAALETVRKWRFEPARLRGEPVAVYYNLTVNFTLR